MKTFCWIGFVIFGLLVIAEAQQMTAEPHNPYDGRPTLDYYLAKSTWVVVGILKTEADSAISGGPIPTPDHPVLSNNSTVVEIEVLELIKGRTLPKSDLTVELCFQWPSRAEEMKSIPTNVPIPSGSKSRETKIPSLFGYQKGAKYIFFLESLPADQKLWAGGKSVPLKGPATLKTLLQDTEATCGKRVLIRTVDPWFGVLPFSEALALGLRQAVAAVK